MRRVLAGAGLTRAVRVDSPSARGPREAAHLASAGLPVLLALLWPAQALAQAPPAAVVEYYHLDALGSVRVVTDQNGQVLKNAAGVEVGRHDFLPFGEEWNPPASAKEKKLFTGHERDAETGLDYFGARYYRAYLGRFTTVDPLGSSARRDNPQTFNRYSYALNNPLKWVDPTGMDVAKSCVQDPSCTVALKMNVIYDRGVSFDKQRLEADYLARAEKNFKHSNMVLDVTYSEGSHKTGEGLVKDRLNVFFRGDTGSWVGQSGINSTSGEAVTQIRPYSFPAPVADLPTIWVNTLEHEMGHWLLGDIGRQANFLARDLFWERRVDAAVWLQSIGSSMQSFRNGTEHLRWAIQANPQANKPK
jgi:RHS repeat-associated protein